MKLYSLKAAPWDENFQLKAIQIIFYSALHLGLCNNHY